jgi:Fe-S cluster assembly iron-binding protein IscA
MLTITRDAATLLTKTRAEVGAPDEYGVRVTVADAGTNPRAALIVAFVPGPAPGDDITEQQGLRAYVAPEVSASLEGATLDATPADGTPPQLVLRRPAEAGNAPGPSGGSR